MRKFGFSSAPPCPRCRRRMLTERGAANLAAGSEGKLFPYWCTDSETWHVWAPTLESHQDAYAR